MATARASATAVLLSWLGIALVSAWYAGPQIEALGLYYDEAFLAQQARDFTLPERAAVHPPSVTTGELFGRPFPIRNAAYLGSLKSQLTIPSFALFGATKTSLRFTILGISLLGLLFAMLAIRRVFGDDIAILTGLLTASDPAFHFFAQFEWGPFASLFLCRGVGVALLVWGVYETRLARSVALWAGAGAAFGLGVYSRVDFAVILAAYGLAALLCAHPVVVRVFREQPRQLAAAALAFLIAVLPVVVVVAQVLSAGSGIADRGNLAYRVDVLVSVLDGSHFARQLEVGGHFDALFQIEAASTVFLPLLVSSCFVAVLLLMRGTPALRRPIAWGLVASASMAAMMLAIEGAVRAHHMLNLAPLPQLIVAAAVVGAWRASGTITTVRVGARVAAAIALLLCVASNIAVIAGTAETIRETGGTGRFSRSVEDFAQRFDALDDAEAHELVSLDWGLHMPVHFSTTRVVTAEPIWAIGQALSSGRGWKRDGSANTIYLFHQGRNDLFGFGEAFARLLRIHDGRVRVEVHRDGRGDIVFRSARFDGDHSLDLAMRGGTPQFRLRWSGAALPPPDPAAPR